MIGDCEGACPIVPKSRCGANLLLATAPEELFLDFAGADGSAQTLADADADADADLRLAPGAPGPVLSGGVEATGAGYCTPHALGAAAECAPVPTDFHGLPRTPGASIGASIGAFERD